MEEKDPCRSLLNKTFAEVLADGELKKQLKECFRKEVFKVYGVKLVFDEKNVMFIKFSEEFFATQSDFQWQEKPSKTKIERLYDTFRLLQKDFGDDFLISGYRNDCYPKLRVKLRLPLNSLRKKKNQRLESIAVGDLIKHVQEMWLQLMIRLRNRGLRID